MTSDTKYHFITENNNYAGQRTLKSRAAHGHRFRGEEDPVQGECSGARGEETAGHCHQRKGGKGSGSC